MSLCTEEEAKKRWCPFARAVCGDADHTVVSTYNRPWIDGGLAQQECSCIASQCMAWRWAEQGHDAGDFSNTPEHPSTGYCGLASDPDPLVTTLPISALNMPAGKP